jgi:hypothetical protein
MFKILKKKLDEHKGSWAEDLLEVLWAYWTTKCTLTGNKLFVLAFKENA